MGLGRIALAGAVALAAGTAAWLLMRGDDEPEPTYRADVAAVQAQYGPRIERSQTALSTALGEGKPAAAASAARQASADFQDMATALARVATPPEVRPAARAVVEAYREEAAALTALAVAVTRGDPLDVRRALRAIDGAQSREAVAVRAFNEG